MSFVAEVMTAQAHAAHVAHSRPHAPHTVRTASLEEGLEVVLGLRRDRTELRHVELTPQVVICVAMLCC
jgi:hypothetical protein